MINETFRLFISSTFSDFQKEREILQTKIFPRIKTYCALKGYVFQPIDLRWGVKIDAQLDQKTLELCLSEVRNCKTYRHPNFLIMIGDRYGWIPLPYIIDKIEFDILLGLMSKDEKKAVLDWYHEDLNQLPTSYFIKERNGNNTIHSTWEIVEKNLRTILQKTAREATNRSLLTIEQQQKYFLSVTEAEAKEGIISYANLTLFQQSLIDRKPELIKTDAMHVFGFFRDINKSTKKPNKFYKGNYEKAQVFKHQVMKTLQPKNILHVQTIQNNKNNLHEDYLTLFENHVTNFLKKQFTTHRLQKLKKPLALERERQHYYAEQKRQHFIGQENSLNVITDYITGENEQPLIIFGPSGCGKSALMAKSIKLVENKTDRQILYCFVGASSKTSNSKDILISIFEQLNIDIQNRHTENTYSSLENQESFEQFSDRIHDEILVLKEPVTIFIDAVDQLKNADHFLWLPYKLPSHIKIILSVLNDKKHPKYNEHYQSLNNKSTNLHEIPPFKEQKKLLHKLLETENRTITHHQETYFLQQYTSTKTPFYVFIAVQEIKHWKSFHGITDQSSQTKETKRYLANSQKEIIKDFINNLHIFYHHDQKFVQKILGYLYASVEGLSESELLQLIATDQSFIEMMAPETYHKNLTKELPLVIWSRLYTHLSPMLSKKSQDGAFSNTK